jgi:hypothetical protein
VPRCRGAQVHGLDFDARSGRAWFPLGVPLGSVFLWGCRHWGGDGVPSRRRSIRAMRSAHTQPNTHVVSPMIKACSNSEGLLVSGQMALAIPSIRCATAGLWRLMLASPCRRALRLETVLPAGVFGPRLLRAFLRLAAICFSELTSGPLWVLRPRKQVGLPPLPRFRPQDWARTLQCGRWERVAVMRVRYRAWTQAGAQLAQARRQMQLPPFCPQERVGVRLPQCRRWE